MTNSNFIFEQSIKPVSHENEFYTVAGLEDFLDSNSNPRVNDQDNAKVLAKKIMREDGSVRYWIKLTNNSKLYNPFSIYGEEKNSSFLDRVCRNTGNKFREVSSRTFDFYLKFLQTKNAAWFNNAEREAE